MGLKVLKGSGFRVVRGSGSWGGLGLEVWVLGFRAVCGLGFWGCRALRFGIQGLGFKAQGLGFTA